MTTKTYRYLFLMMVGLFLISCRNEPKELPILGNREITGNDTVYHSIPDIKLIDQDSQEMRLSAEANKIVVADFFFTSLEIPA